jgi:hypothetical protein
MRFRILDVQALLLAALVFGLSLAAKAQSNGGGQRILFSSPDGQITSNAPLPMAQAPEPQETPDLPYGEAAAAQFSGPPAPMFLQRPPALQQDDARSGSDLKDPTDFRKQMGLLTPAQIMNVPSREQIFGLAEKSADAQKKEMGQSPNAVTNDLASDTAAVIGEPGWANKAWSGDTEKGGNSNQSSNTTDKASGLFGGFFDTARSDDVFGSHTAGNADTLFGPSQTSQSAPQSPWNSELTSGDFMPSAPATEPVPTSFTAPVALSSDWTSQSPFTPPQLSTLDALPKLPALPSTQPQNDQFNQPSAAPSWGPKPPPWTQPQTPLGTPAPLNNTLSR